MFIFNTDQGYLCGEKLHHGTYFGTKDQARRFTYEQVKAFGDGIAADLIDYYCCENIYLEQVMENN
jgi:hypothetical protein